MSKYGGEAAYVGTYLEPPPGLDPDCILFLGDPNRKTYSFFQRLWMPVAMGIACVGGSLFTNRAARMPFRAGMYKHIVAGAVGVGIGEGAWKLKCNITSERDIQYYHYMVMHPEDFQAPEKKKWADVLKPWVPLR